MPQAQLPLFPNGVVHITSDLAVEKRDGQVFYFNGFMPVFSHADDDVASFRMIAAQLCANGNVKQADICRAFGVTKISMKRAVKLYREKGARGFFEARRPRGPSVLTPEVLGKAQELLDASTSISEVGKKLGVKPDTLRKAIRKGRLHRPKTQGQRVAGTTKGARSARDSQAKMGMGATNALGRVAARFGLGPEAPRFEAANDVSGAGMLLALPALLSCGLLKNARKHFTLPNGYYSLESLFLLLGFMALARIKSVESLRYCPPGEWGNVLGLDRIPEVRTLRKKIKHLSKEGRIEEWSGELGREWLESSEGMSDVLYVDGHVRVYHGKQTQLPRHYVARQRLCLRATTDYWVNTMDGQPIFVINKEIDPGLLKVLEHDIVPRLEHDVPDQPTDQELTKNPLLHRFTMVFDREGYSPGFFKRMRDRSIACLTYHKHPKADWPAEEFNARTVELACGNQITMHLAERGTYLSDTLWVREIRKLSENGRQTSVLSTDYGTEQTRIAAAMFARWSQENFFGYMRKHYGLDSLIEYGTEEIPETTKTINPQYRQLDGKIRSKNGTRTRKLAEFGAIQIRENLTAKDVERFELKQAQLREEIQDLEETIADLKSQRKLVAKHITFGDLPEDQRFKRLSTRSKYLIDTVKMIAYRAETSLAHTICEFLARTDDARSLVRAILTTEADLLPDTARKILTVRLHHQASALEDHAVRLLCSELNETQTVFPGSDMVMRYELGSFQNP